MKHKGCSFALVIFFLLSCSVTVCAEEYSNTSALDGVSEVKVYFDVNIGIPEKLKTRLMMIEKTYTQLNEAGVKTKFVVGFRGKASYFVTKGYTDYVLEEEADLKKTIHHWIDTLSRHSITLEQCMIAAEIHDIEPADFLGNLNLVKNGYVSMIGYQAKGYSQVPMD